MSLPPATSTNTCAKLKIASFEPSVGMSSRSGSSVTPKRRATQPAIAARSSGKPSAFGYPMVSASAVRQRAANERIGGLARVTLPEVDDVDAAGRRLLLCLLETDERVRRLLGQHGGERHAATLAGCWHASLAIMSS